MTSLAIVGAGAIGQFYGAQFVLAGHEVRFLARRDAGVLASRGLTVHQAATPMVASTARLASFTLTPDRYRVATTPAALAQPPPEWVLVTLKTTALPEAEPLLRPLIGPGTRLVAMVNGLGVEDRLAAWFDPRRVFGVMCFVCVNRDGDGAVRHTAYGQVATGHFGEDASERARLTSLFRSSGIDCLEPASLLEARWRKLVWNVPYNGLGAAYDRTTDGIVGDPALRAESRLLMDEVIATGNADLAAAGQTARIEPAWADEQERRTLTMGPYAPSTLLDQRAGLPLEAEAMFAEPLRRARRLGVPAPAMERLGQLLAKPKSK